MSSSSALFCFCMKETQAQRETERVTHTHNRREENKSAMGHPVALAGVLALLSGIFAIHNWHKTPDRVPLWWDLQDTFKDL